MHRGKIGLVCLVTLVGCVAALAEETQIAYLSGQGKDDPVPWEFFCTAGRNSGTWTTIGVPSNWELQGFGTYNYGHDKNKATSRASTAGRSMCRRSWADKRIFIVFDGVMTDTEVFVNGKSAGPKHQGGFYRFKYEITDLVKTGDNLLEVTVSKVSSDASVEDAERQADYWVFGGIYRPVCLEAVPKQFIEWVAIDARADGTFRVDVHLSGTGDCRFSYGGDYRVWARPFEAKLEPGREKVTLQTQVRAQDLDGGDAESLHGPRDSAAGGPHDPHGDEAIRLPHVRGPAGRRALSERTEDQPQGRLPAQLLAGLGPVPEPGDQLRRRALMQGDEHERRADVALSAG